MTRLLRTYRRTFLTNKPLVRVVSHRFPAQRPAFTEQHQTMVKLNWKAEVEKGLLSFCCTHTLNAPPPVRSALYTKTGHRVFSIANTVPGVCIQRVNSVWGHSRDWASGEGKRWPHNYILSLLLVVICLWLCPIQLGEKRRQKLLGVFLSRGGWKAKKLLGCHLL